MSAVTRSGERLEGLVSAPEGCAGWGGIRENLEGYDSPVLPERLLSGGHMCRVKREGGMGLSLSASDPGSSANTSSLSSSSKGS